MKTRKLALALSCLALLSTAHANNLKIIGGEKTSIQQYPWMAGLVNVGSASTDAFCGASVVAPEWILTAAHCLEGERADNLEVIMKTDDLQNTNSAERIKAAAIFMHPNYNSNTIDNDIALIRLSKPTSATVIRMATSADAGAIATGQPVSVSGWGNLSATGQDFSAKLHAVSVQIMPFDNCNSAYNNELNSNQICAGVPQGGKDSCQGDSGGPLIARTTSGAVQVGVVSFGEGCALASHPGVYSKVAGFGSFLDRVSDASNDPMPSNPTPANPTPTNPAPTNPAPDNDTDLPATTADLLEGFVFNSFGMVSVGQTGRATVAFENMSSDPVMATDLQILGNSGAYITYEDCMGYELYPREVCYIDLEWTPTSEGKLNATVSMQAYSDYESQAVKFKVSGVAQSSSDFADAIEMSDVDFESDHDNPWVTTNEYSVDDNDSIETEFNSDDYFSLTGDFYNDENIELSFWYMLEEGSCIVYVDDEATYEMLENDDWTRAKVRVPTGAKVRWDFTGKTTRNAKGKVRLDKFSKQALDTAAQTESSTPNSATPSTPALSAPLNASAAPSSGGSFSLWLLLASLTMLAYRRLAMSASRGKRA